MTQDKSKTVSFRIPANYWPTLLERATDRGVSPGDFARHVLLDSLLRDSIDSVRQELMLIRDLVEKMRSNDEISVVALLMHAGKTTEEDAKDFIERTFQ
jgi:hypothetical protein